MLTSLGWVFLFLLGTVTLQIFFVRNGLALLQEQRGKGRLFSFSSEQQKLSVKPWHFLDIALLGSHLSFVLGVTILTLFFTTYLPWGGAFWAILSSAVVITLFGDLLPRVRTTAQTEKQLSLSLFQKTTPFFYPLLWCGDRLRLWLGKGEGEKRSLFHAGFQGEEFWVVPGIQEEILDVEERRIIDRISMLGEITVREVMIPLVRIVAMEETATVREVTRKIQEYGYSRIPIYRERIYNIIGVVNAFDILLLPPEVEEISSIIRPAYYTPDVKRADSLLQEMQRKGIQMAVVVDEYGGSIGIATIEDLLEEIVGEIEDEYDSVRNLYEELPDGEYRFDARMEIDAINEKLGLNLRKGDYETLGGFVIALLERIPQPGEEFEYEHLLFHIESATDRAIQKIRIKPKKISHDERGQ